MCFLKFKNSERRVKPSIAQEDIPVYKNIGNGWGWLYRMKDKNGKVMRWQKGWHYIELTPFKSIIETESLIKVNGDAFHSLNYKLSNCAKLYIPKGALYYFNGSDYVSSEIVYPK